MGVTDLKEKLESLIIPNCAIRPIYGETEKRIYEAGHKLAITQVLEILDSTYIQPPDTKELIKQIKIYKKLLTATNEKIERLQRNENT